jgi:hypothetical protein
VAEAFGCSPEQLASIPAEVNINLSSSNRTAFARLKRGLVVRWNTRLDLFAVSTCYANRWSSRDVSTGHQPLSFGWRCSARQLLASLAATCIVTAALHAESLDRFVSTVKARKVGTLANHGLSATARSVMRHSPRNPLLSSTYWFTGHSTRALGSGKNNPDPPEGVKDHRL